MRLARVTQSVAEAAERLRKLDSGRTVHNQNELHCALAGGLGAKVRNQVVTDLDVVLEAVLGRLDGGDAAA